MRGSVKTDRLEKILVDDASVEKVASEHKAAEQRVKYQGIQSRDQTPLQVARVSHPNCEEARNPPVAFD